MMISYFKQLDLWIKRIEERKYGMNTKLWNDDNDEFKPCLQMQTCRVILVS